MTYHKHVIRPVFSVKVVRNLCGRFLFVVAKAGFDSLIDKVQRLANVIGRDVLYSIEFIEFISEVL